MHYGFCDVMYSYRILHDAACSSLHRWHHLRWVAPPPLSYPHVVILGQSLVRDGWLCFVPREREPPSHYTAVTRSEGSLSLRLAAGPRRLSDGHWPCGAPRRARRQRSRLQRLRQPVPAPRGSRPVSDPGPPRPPQASLSGGVRVTRRQRPLS